MTDYELIMCIVNTGFTETVMDAAREKGARGGTVIHARGTANKEAEEFFHITVQPDKEIVMILVPAKIKDGVLHAIYQSAGLKTDGQGIAFSMPVTNVVGISEQSNAQKPQKVTKRNMEKSAEEPPAPASEPNPKPDEQEQTEQLAEEISTGDGGDEAATENNKPDV